MVNVVNLDNAHGGGKKIFNMIVEDITENHISEFKLKYPYNKGILIKKIVERVEGWDSIIKKLNLKNGDIIYKISDKSENANVAYLNKIYDKSKKEKKIDIILHVYKPVEKISIVIALKQAN